MIFSFNNDKPFRQIVAFLVIILLSVGLFFSLSTVVAIIIYGKDIMLNLNDLSPESISAMKLIQAGTHLGLFLIPALVFSFLSGISVGKYLNIANFPSGKQVIMSLVIIIVALPIIGLLNEINMQMTLPSALAGIENWMKEMEENAKQVTEAIVLTDNFNSYLANLFVIAVLPAIGEEFVFRGVLMRIFSSFIKNIHLNIFIISFLFSAMHVQFYGFLPRFALGMLLGYLFYWSGSLWLPILVHFINNGLTVTIYFLFQSKIITQNPDDFGNIPDYNALIFNVIILGLIFIWFYKTKRPNPLLDSPISTTEFIEE